MGRKVVLHCPDVPSLKLGPADEIAFANGYADVDVERFPLWRDWAFHPGHPFIRVLKVGEAPLLRDRGTP